MSGIRLPPVVEVFLIEHASSLEELGILLALVESNGRWWNASGMAGHASVPVAEARRVLETFASQNLLDIRISDDVRYRLRPGTPELQRGLEALADVHRRSPSVLLQWAVDRTRAGDDRAELSRAGKGGGQR